MIFIAMRAAAVAAIGLLLLSTGAWAAAFMVRENSAESLATVYAGNGSRAEDLSTVFNNPAGMSRLEGTEVEFGVVELFPSIHFDGGASVLGTPIPGDNGGNGGKPTAIPHLYAKTDFSERLKFGIAVTVPFGNAVNYDTTPLWAGRYVGIKTAAITADINPSFSYRLTDMISVGGGLSAQYLRFDVSSAIPQFVIFGPGTPDAIYRLRVDDWALGFNLGVLVDLGEGTRIGATYRSKVDHRVKGTLNFTGASPYLGLASGAAQADVSMPGTFGLSITREISPEFSLSSDVQLTQWSVFKDVIVQSANGPFPFYERYEDSWMIAVGGVYRATPSWSLRAGAGWDQTPVRDAYRTVGIPDTDRYMIGIGAGYRFNDLTSLDAAYAHYFASERASMNSSLNNTDPFTGAVMLNGRYDNHLDYVALTLRQKL